MMEAIYSARFMASIACLLGSLALLDDWLKRDRFVLVGQVYSYFGRFIATGCANSFFTHGLVKSYLEACNCLTAAVSTPANFMAHSLLLWGPEATTLNPQAAVT